GEPSRLTDDDVSSADDLDDLVMMVEHEGIAFNEEALPSQRKKGLEPELDEEELDLGLTPDVLDKTSDPVRLYLREMGTVPLLNPQGEIEIAKRFERGHFRVFKAISRCPIIIREVIAMGADLESGVRSIKELVIFDEEDVTDDIVAARLKATLTQIK